MEIGNALREQLKEDKYTYVAEERDAKNAIYYIVYTEEIMNSFWYKRIMVKPFSQKSYLCGFVTLS